MRMKSGAKVSSQNQPAAYLCSMQKTMSQYVAEFTDHLRQAKRIADDFQWEADVEIANVVICGLGGSGIGGSILGQLISEQCPVPIQSVKGYTIPGYVGDRTLVIACSYSGNTEETLEAVGQAIEKDAQIACISSGGKLSDMAVKHNWPLITVPGGDPPRAAFGFAMVELLRMAEVFGLTSSAWNDELEKAIELLDQEEEKIQSTARQLAESIQHKLPVIYSSPWLEGVATRWTQQVGENSKGLSWKNVYPEMNHNELVGWASGTKDLAVIFLLSDHDHPRVARRMELSETIIRKHTPHIHHYKAKGSSRLEQALYLIHLGDWMTVYLAAFKGVDDIEIEVIDWLKGELAKF
jgi:glucose/mannose-6-phosphate isomerase